MLLEYAVCAVCRILISWEQIKWHQIVFEDIFHGVSCLVQKSTWNAASLAIPNIALKRFCKANAHETYIFS